MKMKKAHLLFVFIVLLFGSCSKQEKDTPADHVNLLIGTAVFSEQQYMANYPQGAAHYGCVVPGPKAPYGFVQISPVTSFEGHYHTRGSGYKHTDSTIMGFTHLNHEYNLYANLLIMPTTGALKIKPAMLANPEDGYRAYKDYSSEIANAAYYSVKLKDYNVKAEFTVTENAALHRYTFPKSNSSRILIDLSVSQNFMPIDSAAIKIIDEYTVAGSQYMTDTVFTKNLVNIHFVARFNKPFKNTGIWNMEKIDSNIVKVSGQKIGFYAGYHTSQDEEILVKVSVSEHSQEKAFELLNKELPDWDFEKTCLETKEKWNNYLSKIQIKGGNADQKTIFYTSLYRSLDSDNIANKYGPMWLQIMLFPEKIEDWLKNKKWSVSGGGFWATGKAPFVLGLYNRGFTNFDIRSAYDTIVKSATDYKDGWIRLKDYEKFGYIPYNRETKKYWDPDDWADVTSRTLGYSYSDYCIAQLSKIMDNEDNYHYFLKRSENYLNLYDNETGFFRPKYPNGSWVEPFDAEELNLMRYYREGNAWQYFWFAHHAIDTLIQLTGGLKEYERKLDTFFTKPCTSSKVVKDISGFIGQYTHGNETDRWVAYNYIATGNQLKTCNITREILSYLYKNTHDGLCGMDDHGGCVKCIGFLPDRYLKRYILA